MALTQKYGIKYPLSSDNNENVYMDVNETYADSVKSAVLHVILTQKGQKLRDPDFGTNLVNYIFGPADQINMSAIKREISTQISKYVPGVIFNNLEIYRDENDMNNIMVSITYSVKNGNNTESTTVAIKL